MEEKMLNISDFITKAIAVVQAIESNPQLLSAVMAVIALFHPNNPTPVVNVPAQAEQMTMLRTAFDNSPQVHQAMQANGLAASGSSLGDLFNEFLKLLPLIAQVLAMFGKTATA